MPFLCYFYLICSSTTWNTYTAFRKNVGGRVGCEGAWKTWVRLILLTRGPEEPVPSQGANSNSWKLRHHPWALEDASPTLDASLLLRMGDDPESPSSRCTSPDLHGYTTAGEEQVAGDTSDCNSNSSNRTVRDPSPPRLRPWAHTVPKYIWKRPADRRPRAGTDSAKIYTTNRRRHATGRQQARTRRHLS